MGRHSEVHFLIPPNNSRWQFDAAIYSTIFCGSGGAVFGRRSKLSDHVARTEVSLAEFGPHLSIAPPFGENSSRHIRSEALSRARKTSKDNCVKDRYVMHGGAPGQGYLGGLPQKQNGGAFVNYLLMHNFEHLWQAVFPFFRMAPDSLSCVSEGTE